MLKLIFEFQIGLYRKIKKMCEIFLILESIFLYKYREFTSLVFWIRIEMGHKK
jgi:hypothetical protein